MRNNSCCGGCGSLREAMRRGARESVALVRRRSGELRPRRRAVDRAAIGNRHIIWQLTPCRKVARDIGIVGLWKCGIMRLWDYGIGSRRFQFQNSVMVHLHKCTISQFITIVKVPCINIDVCSHFHKMQGASTFRLKPPRRIGRASRVEYNPLTGSAGIIPNIISWRNGVRRRNRIMEAA